jgi:hypothetical protein
MVHMANPVPVIYSIDMCPPFYYSLIMYIHNAGVPINMRYYTVSAVFIAILWSGCSSGLSRSVPWRIPEHQYVFIEFRSEEEGRVVQGEVPPGPMIDFPTFMFDPHSGALASSALNFPVSDSLKIVLGISRALRGAAGGGISSGLEGVYELPHTNTRLTIYGADDTGAAHVRFNNERITVESDGEWRQTTSRTDTLSTPDGTAITVFTVTYRIINRGILEKSKIRKW